MNAPAVASTLALFVLVTGSPALSQEQVLPAFAPGIPRANAPGIVAPTPVVRSDPKYTSDAIRARVEGEVWIEVVVNADGTVGETRIAKSLDPVYGLDDQAVAAARNWRFRPGLRDGQPVPVVATLILEFRIHTGPQGPSRIYPPWPASDAEFRRGASDATAPGVTSPRVIRPVEPKYTSDAMRAKVQGTVAVEVVVEPNGQVSRARLRQRVHPDLDQSALGAALEYRFEPGSGMVNGVAAPVVVTLQLEFRLH